MGQQISSHSGRRRLISEEDYLKAVEKNAFRPFDGWNYGYENRWENIASFTVWGLVTVGSLAVDWREALIVLGGSLWAQEKGNPLTRKKVEEDGTMGGGASWVHNIQAGYCLYHYWEKKPAKILVELAVAAEGAADAQAYYMGGYADDVHFEGLLEGVVAAWVLDKFVFKTKQPLFKVQY